MERLVLEPPMPLAKYCQRFGLSDSALRDLHETQGFPMKKIGKNYWVSPLAVLDWYESYEETKGEKPGRDGELGNPTVEEGPVCPEGEELETYRSRRRAGRDLQGKPGKGKSRLRLEVQSAASGK